MHFLVGNNGCGKSTILRALCEALDPLTGNTMAPGPGKPYVSFANSASESKVSRVVFSPSQKLAIMRPQLSTQINDPAASSIVNDPEEDIRALLISVRTQDLADEARFYEACGRAHRTGSAMPPTWEPKLQRFKDAMQPFLPEFEVDSNGNVIVGGTPRPYSALSDGEKYVLYRMAQITKDLGLIDGAVFLLDCLTFIFTLHGRQSSKHQCSNCFKAGTCK